MVWDLLDTRGTWFAVSSLLVVLIWAHFALRPLDFVSPITELVQKTKQSHSGLVGTKSPRMAGNLSNVMDTAPLTCSSFFIACKACTEYVSLSLNSLISLGLAFGT